MMRTNDADFLCSGHAILHMLLAVRVGGAGCVARSLLSSIRKGLKMQGEIRQLEAALSHVDHAIQRLERAAEERGWFLGPDGNTEDLVLIQCKLTDASVMIQHLIPVDRLYDL